MVAVIHAGKSLKNTLNYNENKVKQQAASLIHSSGFAKDSEQLSFPDKIKTLQKLTELNEKTTVNSVHISLNFDTSEKLDKDTLCRIADSYMQKIGFGEQPYLVYHHTDASHPHIHIVTTNIQRNGKRIKLHNIGKNQSEKARKQIEKDFNLVKADSKQRKHQYEIKPIDAKKVLYGRTPKSGTKRAITNVLDAVLPQYKYTSLPELNAVLKQYNLVADQGGKDSRIYKNGGLVYRVLDEKGEKVGVPIPASHIYSKPTLAHLKKRFSENEPVRQKHKIRVKNALDLSIVKHKGATISDLKAALQKESIQLVLRQNADGIIYGLTYVDHQTKCVFNGSDLGKPYSANGVQQRLNGIEPLTQLNQTINTQQIQHSQPGTADKVKETVTNYLQPETGGGMNPALLEEQRRKRKKKINH